MCIERNNLQEELIQYRKNVDLIHVYFYEAMDSMNANQEVSNPNDFDTVSVSLGRLAAASESMPSIIETRWLPVPRAC